MLPDSNLYITEYPNIIYRRIIQVCVLTLGFLYMYTCTYHTWAGSGVTPEKVIGGPVNDEVWVYSVLDRRRCIG